MQIQAWEAETDVTWVPSLVSKCKKHEIRFVGKSSQGTGGQVQALKLKPHLLPGDLPLLKGIDFLKVT